MEDGRQSVTNLPGHYSRGVVQHRGIQSWNTVFWRTGWQTYRQADRQRDWHRFVRMSSSDTRVDPTIANDFPQRRVFILLNEREGRDGSWSPTSDQLRGSGELVLKVIIWCSSGPRLLHFTEISWWTPPTLVFILTGAEWKVEFILQRRAGSWTY